MIIPDFNQYPAFRLPALVEKARAEQYARMLASLDETDWKEFVVGLLRSYLFG